MVTGVICFGDSILAGTGALSRENGCAKRLKRRLKVPVSLKGINRNTSEDGLARLQEDVLLQKNFSHVVVLFGNNDCRLTETLQLIVSQERFLTNLREISNRIKANHQIPLFCNLQPIDAQKLFKFAPEFQKHNMNPEVLQETYNNLVEDFTRRNGDLIIDIRTPLKSQKAGIMAVDGLHPNDNGHAIIAQRIVDALIKLDPNLCITD